MTEHPGSVDSFLAEWRESLSLSGGDAILRRINAERLLRLLADEFTESHQAQKIRILPDSRLAGKAGADFLVQIDDYDIRLLFLDAPEGMPAFDARILPDIHKLLEDNPSTVALILVWTTDDLLAVPLSWRRARRLSQTPERLPALLAEARPLPETLRAIVEGQTRLLEAKWDQTPRTTQKSADLRRLFEEAIGAAIDVERQRSYRYAERKLAARRFPIEREKWVVFSVLGEALAGAPSHKLVQRLTNVSQRGAR